MSINRLIEVLQLQLRNVDLTEYLFNLLTKVPVRNATTLTTDVTTTVRVYTVIQCCKNHGSKNQNALYKTVKVNTTLRAECLV